MLKGISWNRKTLIPDLMSSLTVALVSIPEGMAYAMVAGVDPVYGLYTGMVTTIVASLTGSTSLMIVTLTNALALASNCSPSLDYSSRMNLSRCLTRIRRSF